MEVNIETERDFRVLVANVTNHVTRLRQETADVEKYITERNPFDTKLRFTAETVGVEECTRL
jgi:anti-sigma-K factor RskA